MIKVTTGMYAEIFSAVISYDGDYLSGTVKVRVVSNGMDNLQQADYPDCYGYFVQDKSPETVKDELVPKMQEDIKEDLISMYGFTKEDLKNLRFKFSFTN